MERKKAIEEVRQIDTKNIKLVSDSVSEGELSSTQLNKNRAEIPEVVASGVTIPKTQIPELESESAIAPSASVSTSVSPGVINVSYSEIGTESQVGGMQILRQSLQPVSVASANDVATAATVKSLTNNLDELAVGKEKGAIEQSRAIDTYLQQGSNKRDFLAFKQALTSVRDTGKSVSLGLSLQNSAVNLTNLFDRQITPGQNTYFAQDYSITRFGKNYTLSDAAGNDLMSWHSSAFGLSIDKVNLSSKGLKDLQSFSEDLRLGGVITGNLKAFGQQEAVNFACMDAIINGLVDYAQARGSKVEIQGTQYSWSATPDGDVTIRNNEGQALLAKTGGAIANGMSERDMAFFESALKSIQTSTTMTSNKKGCYPRESIF